MCECNTGSTVENSLSQYCVFSFIFRFLVGIFALNANGEYHVINIETNIKSSASKLIKKAQIFCLLVSFDFAYMPLNFEWDAFYNQCDNYSPFKTIQLFLFAYIQYVSISANCPHEK